jgi:hypothetical protein
MRGLGLPAFSSEVEKLVLAIFQKILLGIPDF